MYMHMHMCDLPANGTSLEIYQLGATRLNPIMHIAARQMKSTLLSIRKEASVQEATRDISL